MIFLPTEMNTQLHMNNLRSLANLSLAAITFIVDSIGKKRQLDILSLYID